MKTLPAGKYYIGDCCYVLGDGYPKERNVWNEFCDQFFVDGENIIIDGLQIVAYSTAHGDGVYPSNVGYEFPVDAGLIGCTPAELWKGEGQPFGCRLITFKTELTCDSDGSGKLDLGGVVIDTNQEYPEYDEEDE